MSQEQSTEAQRAEERTQDTRAFVRRVRTLTRRKYTPEEKIRIVLEGFRREVTVSDLCRREGIKPGAYYAWTKDPSTGSGCTSWRQGKSVSPGTPFEMPRAKR